MRRPGSTVTVEIASPATLLVWDRGPGVPEAERDRIFARFHRSPSGRGGGAGLGLAIVAEIAADAWRRGLDGGAGRRRSVFVLRLNAAAA